MKITKKALKEFMQKKIRTDKTWAERALLKIYSFQTEGEKAANQTSEFNGVGFAGPDAEFLSSLAKQLIKNGWLSEKQLGFAQKKMPRYWRQLMAVSNIELLKQKYLEYPEQLKLKLKVA